VHLIRFDLHAAFADAELHTIRLFSFLVRVDAEADDSCGEQADYKIENITALHVGSPFNIGQNEVRGSEVPADKNLIPVIKISFKRNSLLQIPCIAH
jgi:hypothetical protein